MHLKGFNGQDMSFSDKTPKSTPQGHRVLNTSLGENLHRIDNNTPIKVAGAGKIQLQYFYQWPSSWERKPLALIAVLGLKRAQELGHAPASLSGKARNAHFFADKPPLKNYLNRAHSAAVRKSKLKSALCAAVRVPARVLSAINDKLHAECVLVPV